MRFHDIKPAWKILADKTKKLKGGPKEVTEQIIRKLSKNLLYNNPTLYFHTICELNAQLKWLQDSRPYYDLYPSVIEAFAKVDLDKISVGMVKLPLPGIMIRLPVGHEYKTIRAILAHETVNAKGERFWIIQVNDGVMTSPASTFLTMQPPESTIMQHIQEGIAHPYCDDSDVNRETQEIATRIVTTVCLIKGNPDIIEPEPLEADRAEWLRTHNEDFLKIAAKKGKRAWSIGKHIEVAPGFRRPHFGIRWMGHGVNKDPVLRPIKGCLVMRQKLTEIPTGWLGEDAT